MRGPSRIPDTGAPPTGSAVGGPSPARRPLLPRWVWRGLLVILTLIAWAPVLSVMFTVYVADHYGCRVDEGGVHPCTGWGGQEIGPLLATTGVLGWGMLVTFPFMVGTAIAWLVILVRRIRRPRA